MAVDACGLRAHRQKVAQSEYSDDVAEEFAKKVGVAPRPNETKSEIGEIYPGFVCG